MHLIWRVANYALPLVGGTGPWLWLWLWDRGGVHIVGPLWAWGAFGVLIAVIGIVTVVLYIFDPDVRGRPGFIAVTVLGAVSSIEGIFADTYYVFARSSAGAFGGPFSKPDAAYFSISTATSTGMGDIHPLSGGARLLVTGQMVISVFLIVLALSTVVQFLVHRESRG